MSVFLWSVAISDSDNFDELELRRRKRASERASKKDDGEPPKTKTDPEQGGSGRPPRPRKTAVGASDGGDGKGPGDRLVRLIDHDGTQLGIVPYSEALRLAKEQGLQLYFLVPDSNPPVAKIMDYGQFKFDLEKKVRETKRKHHIIDVKEIKMRYQIEEHDYQIKLKHAHDFLKDGDKIKVLLVLRGRDMQHIDTAQNLLQKFADDLREVAFIDREPSLEGKSVLMILSPCAK